MGWFSDRTLDIPTDSVYTTRVILAAFSEAAAKSNKDGPVLLTAGPYSFQYNRATEFNRGTQMFRDTVTITHYDSSLGATVAQPSGLGPGSDMFVVNDFGGSGKHLQVEACYSIGSSDEDPSAMVLGISVGSTDDTSPCDDADFPGGGDQQDLGDSSDTENPTATPTASPTFLPTTIPTGTPTESPEEDSSDSENPTAAPTPAFPPTAMPSINAPPMVDSDEDLGSALVDFPALDSIESMSLLAYLAAYNTGEDTNLPIVLMVGPYTLYYEYVEATNAFRPDEMFDRSVVKITMDSGFFEDVTLVPGGSAFTENDFDGSDKDLRIAACAPSGGAATSSSHVITIGITLNIDGSPCDTNPGTVPATTTTMLPPPYTTMIPATTTTTMIPATTTTTVNTNTICPDTRNYRVTYFKTMRRGKEKFKQTRCRSVADQPSPSEFCDTRTNEPGQTVGDVCLQECAFHTGTCTPQT